MSDSIRSYCRECSKHTNHTILKEDKEVGNKDYSYELLYQIVQCNGCDTKSFRKEFIDIESAYPISHDEWDVPRTVSVYPKAIEGHHKIDDIYEIPDIVEKIYSEVIIALKEKANILAGLGLRGVIEAICNDLSISGRTLEVRINKLATAGYISKKDAERLHGIRFMGNDAAHDIKSPKKKTLLVALQIIEHLIASVYILEKKASDTIETTISNYNIFIKILEEKLQKFNSEDEFPIAKFLSENLRRVKESITNLENELIEKITSGEFTKLKIGKKAKFQGSKEELQHFIVV